MDIFNVVEMMCVDESYQAPCRHGSIVHNFTCYCHNSADGMPRKCKIYRKHGISNLDKWKQAPWLPESPHIRQIYRKDLRNDPEWIKYQKYLGFEEADIIEEENGCIKEYEIRRTWPEEGCPEFEASPEFKMPDFDR